MSIFFSWQLLNLQFCFCSKYLLLTAHFFHCYMPACRSSCLTPVHLRAVFPPSCHACLPVSLPSIRLTPVHCLPAFPPVCLSDHLLVACPRACPPAACIKCPPACLFTRLSARLSTRLPDSTCLPPPTCLPVRLLICLSTSFLPVDLSVCSIANPYATRVHKISFGIWFLFLKSSEQFPVNYRLIVHIFTGF